MCTCYASPTSSIYLTHHRHIRSSDRIAAIFACLSACAPATGLPILNNRNSCLYIYIYISPRFLIFGSSPPRSCRIPSLSSYTIATKTVHPSIVNIIISFFFLYIYILFSSYKHVFTYYLLFTICSRYRVARDWGKFEFGGGGYRPPRYLSIYPLSIRDFVFIFRSFFRTRKRSETANGRRMHAISGETDSREYFTENTKRSLGVFALGGKRVEMGEGKGGRGGGAMKTPQLASPESSTSFTFFPSWSIHTFHSVHPFHRFSPEILEYRRSIFLMRIPE